MEEVRAKVRKAKSRAVKIVDVDVLVLENLSEVIINGAVVEL